MRKKIMFLILPLCFLMIFSGVALGSWYFGALSASNNGGANVDVEGMANYYGQVTIPNKNDIKIVVHQKGIQLNQQIRVEYDPDTYNYVDGTMDLLYDVYVPAKVDTYIKIHSNRLVKNPTPETHNTTDDLGNPVSIKVYRYSGFWEFQGTKQVPNPNKPGQMKTIYTFTTELSFDYKEGMKPIDDVDVINLFKNLDGQTITAKFEIKPKAGVTPAP